MDNIIYYYTIYLTDGTIHLKPFQTREECKSYKLKADQVWKKENRYKHSKITKRKIDSYRSEFWL